MSQPILVTFWESLLAELERWFSLHGEAVLWYAPLGFVFSLFVLLGLNLLLLGLLCTRDRFHQNQVGETTGTVSSTRLVKRPDDEDTPTYEAQVDYSYQASGQLHKGSVTLLASSRAAKVQAALDAYSPGHRVAVIYDLRSPHLSKLSPPEQTSHQQPRGYGSILAGLLLIVVSYGLGRGMTIGFWPDSWQDPWGLARATGTSWGVVAALLLASGLHSWGAVVHPNLSSQTAVDLFQYNPTLFAVWRSPTYRWLNGWMAGFYVVLAIRLGWPR